MTADVAVTRLRDVKARVDEATARGAVTEAEASALDFAIERTLRDALGANHEDIHRIAHSGSFSIVDMDSSPAERARDRASRLARVAGLLGELISQFDRDIAEAPAIAPPVVEPAALHHVERLIIRFHQVVKRLRVRHDKRGTLDVKDEYDAQDLLHALLSLHFKDIRPEEWTPSYAGKASRMDFLLKAERLVIEVKMTRETLGEKEVGDQLIVDIARYRAHPDCKTLVCFVYDPLGRIGNPEGLEADLSGVREGLSVSVFIAPRS